MKILLDTHILLWDLAATDQLSKKATTLIQAEENTLYYSAVSAFEVELKHQARPGNLSMTGENLIAACEKSDMSLLNLELRHIFALESIDPDAGNPDPFDRILLAQALTVGMKLLTHDQRIIRRKLPFVIGC